jgi:hypothetical protein
MLALFRAGRIPERMETAVVLEVPGTGKFGFGGGGFVKEEAEIREG